MAKGQRLRAKSQEPKAKANCQLPFANCSLLQLASDSLGDGLERVRRAYILDHHGVEHEIRIAFAGDDAGHANFPFLNVPSHHASSPTPLRAVTFFCPGSSWRTSLMRAHLLFSSAEENSGWARIKDVRHLEPGQKNGTALSGVGDEAWWDGHLEKGKIGVAG